MKKFISLLFVLMAYAADITVCASGCTTTDPQVAFDSASPGDNIIITAGETFEGQFNLPFKTGNGSVIHVKSSALLDLPTAGNRVGSADVANMPKLVSSDASEPVLRIGYREQFVSSVNTSTDVITFTGTTGFSDNDPIAFWNDDGSIPVVANQVYYVRDSTATTVKLSLTPGGAVVDLTTTPTATRFRATIARSIANWAFHGIEFSAKTGLVQLFNLVEFTNEATARVGVSNNITFDRVYIHGIQDQDGPRTCLFLNAANFTLTDSTIENCAQEGAESHVIASVQSPGPVLLRNNYFSGGSIGLIEGGDYIRITGLINGDRGGFNITGNHFDKPFWMKYTTGTSGAGAPVGACSDGTHYLRTSNGQWYDCTGSVWVLGPTCADDEYFRSTSVTQTCVGGACWKCASGVFTASTVYRGSGYGVKNLVELKNATNNVIRGNVFNQNWYDAQNGISVLLASKVSQYNANTWVNVQKTTFQDNHVYNVSDGIRTATEGGTTFGVNNYNISANNNLFERVATTDYPSINNGSPQNMSFAGPCVNCTYDHNTVSGIAVAASGDALQFDTAAFTTPRFSNGILYANQYGLRGDLGLPYTDYWGSGNVFNTIAVDNFASQGSHAFGGATNGNYVSGGTTLFVSSSDFRLQATSPYSAKCSSGCGYVSTDGKDLGADIDIVSGAVGGATTGLPWVGGSVTVVPGSVGAIVSYTAPDGSACNLKLYTDIARTTLAADTADSAKWVDTRTGNVTDGTSRQFVLGTVSALTANTQYWGVISCGTSVSMQSIHTLAAGSGTFNVKVKLGAADTGNYSSSADMSSPTSACSGTLCTIPVPTGTVRYFQLGSGPIFAFINK